MNPNIVTGVVVLAFGSSQVFAAPPCETAAPPALTGQAIATLLSNKYGCAIRGDEKWNELHQGTGLGPNNVQDYKKGPGDPIDPTKVVGTYKITDNGAASPGTILYDYGPAAKYTYVVTPGPSSSPGVTSYYIFCNIAISSEVFNVTVKPSFCTF